MTIKLLLIALLSTLIYQHASAQEPSSKVDLSGEEIMMHSVELSREEIMMHSLPIWAMPVLRGEPFTNEYLISTRVNPFLIQGDFNGDGVNDVAVLVTRRKDEKRGIAILHAGASQPIILGAGHENPNGWVDDFEPPAWSVYPKGPVGENLDDGPPPQLRGEALLVIWPEAGSSILYWDGEAYRKYQQDD